MRYFKLIVDGYIISVGTGADGEQITETEYNNILDVIKNKPVAPDGYMYRLKEDLTWELAEKPPMPPVEEEITLEDALEMLRKFGVDV